VKALNIVEAAASFVEALGFLEALTYVLRPV
jgi:hypothetical protein